MALLRDAWALAHKEGLSELLPNLEAQIARVNVEDGFTSFEAEATVTQEGDRSDTPGSHRRC